MKKTKQKTRAFFTESLSHMTLIMCNAPQFQRSVFIVHSTDMVIINKEYVILWRQRMKQTIELGHGFKPQTTPVRE